MVEITAREQNKEKRMKRIEDSLRDVWDYIKHTNIRIIGVPEEEEKKEGSEKIFEEIIVENFPNMGKEIVNQVQEAQRVPYRIKPKRNMPRHILIKLSKIKYKNNYYSAMLSYKYFDSMTTTKILINPKYIGQQINEKSGRLVFCHRVERELESV